MTRETKIGVVLAGAFLSLVGGVTAMRMRNGDPAPSESTQAPPPTTTQTVSPPPPSVEVAAQPTSFAPPPSTPATAPVNDPMSLNYQQPAAASTPPSSEPAPILPTPAPIIPAPEAQPEVKLPAAVEQPKVEMPPPELPKADPAPVPVTPPTIKEVTPPAPNLDQFKSVEAPPEKKIQPPPGAPTATLLDRPAPPKETAPPATTSTPQPMSASLTNTQPTSTPKTLVPEPLPANDNYLEEEYRIRAGDSFESISKKFCFSEKYAAALRQYNRDYPLASPSLRRDSSAPLVAGTLIWIPPNRILEKKYPSLIDGLPAAAHNVSIPAVAAPSPVLNASTNNNSTRPVSATMKTYRVRDGGETLQEIGRRMPNQDWSAILRLNPTLNQNALVPIPGGTLLRLPGDAKIDG